MKQLFILVTVSLLGFSICRAQDLPNLKAIKLNKSTNYKAAEPTALKVSNYLFATPIDRRNRQRIEAGNFLMRWMNGTSDHVFYVEDREMNLFGFDSDVLLMYMAALTKFILEHPQIKDKDEQAAGAIAIVLPYLHKESDKKKWPNILWRLNDAYQQHKTVEFLKQQQVEG